MRPCKVFITKYEVIDGKRTKIRESRKALFHRFTWMSRVVDASPMIGGHPGGVVADTLALVEFKDGHLEQVYLSDIVFYDSNKYFNKFDEYFKEEV